MQGKTLKTSTDGWITLHQYILMSIVALVPVKAEIMEPESCLSNNTAKLISSGIMSVLNFSYTPPAPLLVSDLILIFGPIGLKVTNVYKVANIYKDNVH